MVWKHAYEEAYQNGRREVLQNLKKKLEEKYKEGEAEGVKKGREKYYGKGIVVGELNEHRRWKAAGHSDRCFTPAAIQNNAGTQTDTSVTITATVSTQTCPTNSISSHVATQTSTEAVENINIPTTVDVSNFDMGRTTHLATSHSPALSKNAKGDENLLYGENPPKIAVFFSSTPSLIVLNSTTSSPNTPALETPQKTAGFIQKCGKVGISSFSTQTSPETFSPSIVGPINDATRAHTTQTTPNDDILRPPTISAIQVASSSQAPAVTTGRHPKSELLGTNFTSQSSLGSSEPTCFVTAQKTRPASTDFVENCQKVENSPILSQDHPETVVFNRSYPKSLISDLVAPSKTVLGLETSSATTFCAQKQPKMPFFNQNQLEPPKSPVLDRFNWADEAEALYITSTIPQHPPRDLSCLRTTSTHPFSSLRRKRGRPKNRTRQNAQRSYSYTHPFSTTQHLLSHPHTPFHASLNWDQDPRLADLSKALRALGWVRR